MKKTAIVVALAVAFCFVLTTLAQATNFCPLEARDSVARIPPGVKSLTRSSYSAMGSVPAEENKRQILNKLYSLQIPFIENEGQISGDGVAYYARTLGGTVFVTRAGQLVYSLPLWVSGQWSPME